MKRLRNHLIGVDQGALQLFSHFETDDVMWSGSGPRSVRRWVTFSEPFKAAPAVTVGLEMWDTDGTSNQRGDLSAEHVARHGFDVVFKTWGDTRVARIRASWMAIGPLAHDDDWDVE